jgi:ferredoxin-NADP reductase/predicted pyridoxine 5'-phosphate oxidase superfamily flavin-nucleotide-binding protein
MTYGISAAAGDEETSPFHPGEIALQERFGEQGIEAWARKAIRPYMPDQHRAFYSAQPFLVAAARDSGGRPWATILEGKEGFVSSPDPESLAIGAKPVPGDALDSALTAGADLGLLGIEPATRRRNRVNGTVSATEPAGLRFAVGQSFGNCPQYIRKRDHWWSDETDVGAASRHRALADHQQAWISAADTFFIASGYRGEGDNAAFGMDASHRGGESGFVEVVNEKKIRFPDYAGNSHYNTLGNLKLDPRAGFLFVDFSSGSLLQLTGRASIDWSPEAIAAYPGARQLVTLEIDEIVELCSVLRLRWREEADAVRSLRLVERVRESADVTSFVFEARDGGPLAPFKAGQHLPVEIRLPNGSGRVQRSYSLSGAPSDPRYRISVKREPGGLVSRLLHDALGRGGVIDARPPSGDFTVPEGSGPLVLAGAGIGITPLLSMLHALAGEATERKLHFVHGARDGAHHPFKEEVARLADGRETIRLHRFYSRPQAGDEQGRDYDHVGRITGGFLASLEDPAQADYLLCGPAGFLAEVKADLERHGVPEERILFEVF